MLSGYTRKDTLRVVTSGVNCDNLVWFDRIWAGNFNWAAAKSDLSDLRYTLPDGVTLLPYVFVDPPIGSRKFAQVMVFITGTPPASILRQYGNPAASAVSTADGVMQQPPVPADASGLAVLWLNEGSGTTCANKVGGTAWTVATSGWQLKSHANGWRRGFNTLHGVTGRTDLDAWSGYGGVYLNGGSDRVVAPAGFLDTPPANGSIGFWFTTFGGTGVTGTLFSKYSDANNYLEINQIAGANIQVIKCNGGVAETITLSQSLGAFQTWFYRVSWGAGGFKLWLGATPVRCIRGNTTAWGAGNTGKATFGARDNGSIGNQISSAILGSTIMQNREMAAVENQCYIYNIPPIPTTSPYTKLVQSPSNPILTPAGWEGTQLAEVSVLGPFSDGKYHMIYHGARVTAQVGHATSTDLVAWTKDAANPLFGNGIGGEAGITQAVNAWTNDNAIINVRYVNDFTVSQMRDAVYTPASGSVTINGNVLAPRSTSWPAGFGNNFQLPYQGNWIQITEGRGVAGDSFETGFARGVDATHLTLDASGTDGGSSFWGPMVGGPLRTVYNADGSFNTPPQTSCGGAFGFTPSQGLIYMCVHGEAIGNGTGFIYRRVTPNGFDCFEGPTDVVMDNTLRSLPSGNRTTDQAGDPWMIYANGTTYFYWEELDDAGATGNICLATYAGSFVDLFTDSVRLDYVIPPHPLTPDLMLPLDLL